jgi:hypothetical protein
MAFTVFFKQGSTFIEVQYSGRITPEDVKHSVAQRMELAQAHGIRNFLIDISQTEEIPIIFEQYSLARAVQEGHAGKTGNIAMVVPLSPEMASRLEFYETAAANVGLHVRLFKNRVDAINYLNAPG